jgi:cobalamin biosynthesis protein CobD/CbiB
VHKPTIGDGINEPMPNHIAAANRLMYAATICAVVLMVACDVAFFAFTFYI